MQRALVAGATGYLGGFVACELKKRGYYVRALARSPEKVASLRASLDGTVQGEVTQPGTLEHVCDGVDVVFSSIGITRQKDGLSFMDVDYQGNKNLLEAALSAGVKKFVYVSILDGNQLRHLDIVAAHERFVDELKSCGIKYAIVRPTGYFSDMGEVLEMARKGRVWLIGSGEHRLNPIHGADLAEACADAIEDDETEIDVGGPETMTWNEVAELAFEALDQPAKITRIPQWLMWSVVRLARFFNRHQGELLAFFTTMASRDVVAATTGIHTLEAHYRSLAEKERTTSNRDKQSWPRQAQPKE